MTTAPLDLSVVVPLMNEEDNVAPLVAALREGLPDYRWEVLLVDDGSTDGTARVAMSEGSTDSRVRLVRLARNYGQSTAMQAGFDHAKAPVVVTIDGDLQNDPRDIPSLLAKLDEGYDLVAGYRVRRKDKMLVRRLPSWIANRLIALVTGVAIRDNGCSLKAYRRDLLQRLRLYSDMHRFIPALSAGMAGASIAQIPVRHHHRRHGTSKYGLARIAKVLADILTVVMIRSFRMRPLLLFSYVAAASVGLSAAALALGLRFMSAGGIDGTPSVVLPTVGILFLATAVYLFMLGLLAEVVIPRWDRTGSMLRPLVRDSERTGSPHA